MPDHDDLFNGIHATACALCARLEPRAHLPGWPDSGRFLVVRSGKICSSCLSEAILKREALDRGDKAKVD